MYGGSPHVAQGVHVTSTDSQGSSAEVSGEADELAQRIRDNEAEIALLRGAIEANEASQQSVQARIDGTIEGQGSRNPQLLKMLKQFRLQVTMLAFNALHILTQKLESYVLESQPV